MHTLTADVAFQHCANAAAAAYATPPAYISYHVATHVTAPSLKKDRLIDRSVEARTSDNRAVLQDLPRGENQVSQAFPISPTFDAISNFTLSWHADRHLRLSIDAQVQQPWTYDLSRTSTADVVVVGLRLYGAKYADDSSTDPHGITHIAMHPYQFVVRETPKNDMFFSDVYIDNSTGLPTRIKMTGNDNLSFIVDYAMIQGHWLVNHVHYEMTVWGPLHLGAVHFVAEAYYDDFSFPTAPPDPRLAPPPTPAPSASA